MNTDCLGQKMPPQWKLLQNHSGTTFLPPYNFDFKLIQLNYTSIFLTHFWVFPSKSIYHCLSIYSEWQNQETRSPRVCLPGSTPMPQRPHSMGSAILQTGTIAGLGGTYNYYKLPCLEVTWHADLYLLNLFCSYW